MAMPVSFKVNNVLSVRLPGIIVGGEGDKRYFYVDDWGVNFP